mgnify:CR=1 FL=1
MEIRVKHTGQTYYVVDGRIHAGSDWTDLTDSLKPIIRDRILAKAV